MTVVYINAVQYQTCPNHESDNHFFAKIPEGVRTPGPPSGSALAGHVTKTPRDDGLLSEPTTEVNGNDP